MTMAPSWRFRNFRRYFLGQSVSLVGTWMQRVAQEWLVLELTDSAMWLGLVAALQFGPMLVLSPFAGLVADRRDTRRLIIITQSLSAICAFALAGAVMGGRHVLLAVCLLALALGLITVFDNPARRIFVSELVDRESVTNAVVLSSLLSSVSRAVGPAIGGLLIASVGLGWTFVVNGATYLFAITALVLLRPEELLPAQQAGRSPGEVRAGLRYVWGTSDLRAIIALMAVTGAGALAFSVTLPLLVRQELHLGAEALGILNSALGVGSVVGGIYAAAKKVPAVQEPLLAGALLGLSVLVLAFAPGLALASLALVVAGAASLPFMAMGSSYLQTASRPDFRGRVLAVWGMAFLGTRPIGAPLIGAISEVGGVRLALAASGLVTVGLAAWLLLSLRPTDASAGGGRDEPHPTGARAEPVDKC